MMSEEISAVQSDDSIDLSEAEHELIPGEGYIVDHITGEKLVKDTPKEQVRQFIAKALEQEYNISLEDMQADFVVGSGKSRRVVDIAIFHHLREHSILNLSRAVICRPMLASGRNAAETPPCAVSTGSRVARQDPRTHALLTAEQRQPGPIAPAGRRSYRSPSWSPCV